MNNENLNKLIICMPVYNDWQSVYLLISRIEKLCKDNSYKFDIIIVDDASTMRPSKKNSIVKTQIGNIEILRLRRNLGHQRAIAIGLSYIQAEKECRAVLVMDADGEDSPGGINKLIKEFERSKGTKVIFAKRARRSETYMFKFSYFIYKLIHFVLVGRGIDVGNFSIIPRHLLDRLVGVSELWNHYAASVYRSYLPIAKVPIDRGERFKGQSKMNFVSLVIHGLSALSVYSDVIGVRLLILMVICAILCIGVMIVVLALKYLTTLAIPGWSTMTMGILFLLLSQCLLFSLFFIIITLNSRSIGNFLPVRDYKYFILRDNEVNLDE